MRGLALLVAVIFGFLGVAALRKAWIIYSFSTPSSAVVWAILGLVLMGVAVVSGLRLFRRA